MREPRSLLIAYLLWFFLGVLGIHRFYLGRWVSGLIWLFRWMKWRDWGAVAVAVVLSALIFSTFHYVGPYGDPLTAPSFTFRAIAGLLLSGLYVARGFGITAWTHALYDVGIALFSR